jgi:putative transcriptional regulator
MRLVPAISTLAALLLAAALSRAALPDPGAAPEPVSLAGQLLVATPGMGDPRFYHAVILMVRHDQNGALGIVINRPVADHAIADLLQGLGDNGAPVEGSVRIFAGGPVEPDIGFVIHSAEYHRPETIAIDDSVAVTSSAAVLRDIALKHGPRKSLIAFGYAGWGPGQLEAEIAGHGWFTILADTKLIFDEARDKLWDEALARRGRDL